MAETPVRLVEVAEAEVVIDFRPSTKCRATLHLRSLHPTAAVSFKIQTSAPQKFHVNPPSGLLLPLSTTTLLIILRPQNLPYSPSSPPDRFLIRATTTTTTSATHDTKLNVTYVGPYLRRQGTALHAAVETGACKEVAEMVAAGGVGVDGSDAVGRTALHVAAGKGCGRCVMVLLEGGADKDARSRDGKTALHRAAAGGEAAVVAVLVEAGADAGVVSARGRTALDVARDRGHQKVVEILEHGELVLTAARRGDVKRLASLLRKRLGVCGGRDQYGLTALHSAAIKGHREVVALLVEVGMDVDCRDVEGHTPLHLAVEGGCAEMVELLVDAGANVGAANKRGATPLMLARCMGYTAIAELLVSQGAAALSSPCCTALASSRAIG